MTSTLNAHYGQLPCCPFLCAPGRAHSLGGESSLHTRHGEVLAEGKGVAGDCESEGSRRQSAGLTNRKRIGGDAGGRDGTHRQSPVLAREPSGVDPTGISVKVGAQYPGRSGFIPERETKRFFILIDQKEGS